mgnify:CR=1 FL=1
MQDQWGSTWMEANEGKEKVETTMKRRQKTEEEWRLRREMERRDEVVHERNHIVDHHAHFRVVKAVNEII